MGIPIIHPFALTSKTDCVEFDILCFCNSKEAFHSGTNVEADDSS